MTPQSTARLIQGVGLALLAVGAVLMAIGTTSMGLFVFFAAMTAGGALLFLDGKKRYEKTLG